MNIRNVNDIRMRTELMAVGIALVAIPAIVLGYVSYNAASHGITEESEIVVTEA